MTSYDSLLNVAKMGVPIATVGAVYKRSKKKKKGVKHIIGTGTTAIVGTAFTKEVYS